MLGQPQLAPQGAHLVLEQLAQGLDQLQVHALGQAADVVVRLDGDGGPAGERHALDHVGVERALGQELRGCWSAPEAPEEEPPPSFLASSSNTSMKSPPMVLRLASGSVLPASAVRKRLLASTCTRGILKAPRNSETTSLASLSLSRPWSTKMQVSWCADRLVDQHGGHRAVDAAGEAADDAALADLGPDLGDLGRLEVRHRPVARQAGDAAHEVADQLAAARGVRHLGVELHGVELALFIGDGRERGALRHAHHLEAGRQPGDAIAVAHPHGVAVALGPEALEQRAVGGDVELGAAELAVVAAFDPAAHLRHHRLLAVADAEHGQAGLEHPVGRARGAELGDAGGPARQDHGLGLQPLEGVLGAVEGHDLGVDALLAHAPGDQLRHLAAEIDDEDGVGHEPPAESGCTGMGR